MTRKTFVVSDIWFNRPNVDHKEMGVVEYNNMIIRNWNKSISKTDVVYILGGIGISDLYGLIVKLNGEIHILGAYDASHATKHYKWNGSSWTSVSTLPYAFTYNQAVVFNNGIHILGGGNDSSTYTKHYRWNGTFWTEVSSLPYDFKAGSVVVLNDEIHILGSGTSSSVQQNHYKVAYLIYKKKV